MAGDFYCARCEHEFAGEGGEERPSCPSCGQREPVQSVDTTALMGDIRRQWYVVFGLLFVATAAFALYQWAIGD